MIPSLPERGAWIEIEVQSAMSELTWSLPERERGLKYDVAGKHRDSLASLPERGARVEMIDV